MSLMTSSSSRDRNKYGGIWRRSIYRRVLLFVFNTNHIPPYLCLSREDDDDVRDIGKHDFPLVLLHPMLSNANHIRKLRQPRWRRQERHKYVRKKKSQICMKKRQFVCFAQVVFIVAGRGGKKWGLIRANGENGRFLSRSLHCSLMTWLRASSGTLSGAQRVTEWWSLGSPWQIHFMLALWTFT